MKKKYYVVWNGADTGVFDSWDECKLQINGYPGAKYKSFDSLEAAIEAYRGNPSEHLALFRAMARQSVRPEVNYESFPEIHLNAIAVDAACSHNPGPVEYQGVLVATGERLFHAGPFAGGTNNLGEFLGLAHALAWLDRQHRPDIPIYTDSRTALAWVRNRRANTKLAPTPENAEIRALVARAEMWLATHTPKNPVYKWDTSRWGEIPADFGRK